MNKIVSNNIVEGVSFKDDLSIVVITYKRVDLLNLLIESLRVAVRKDTSSKPQIIVCVNGLDHDTIDYLQSSAAVQELAIEPIILESPVTPAEARNLATAGIHSEWLMFLDDDVEVPIDLISNFRKLAAADPTVTLWGGPNLTPLDSSSVQKKIGWLLENYMVTGPVSVRYKLSNLQELECRGLHFSLCNMFVRTREFKKILFNTLLKTAEENELVFKFAKHNFRMKASDQLYVWHSRRGSIPHFLNQIKNYGFGRGQLIYYGSVPVSIPALLLALVVVLALAAVKVPFILFFGCMGWLVAIFVKLGFEFNFRKNNIFDIFLPARLWFNYAFGLVQGFIVSHRINSRL